MALVHLGGDRWRVFVEAGVDPRTGRRKRPSQTITATGKRDAEKQARAIEEAMNADVEGQVHELLVDLYTNGWCPLFACALKSLDPSLELVETGEDCWHVAVVDVHGCIWDVTGRNSRKDFAARWGKPFRLLRDEVMYDLEQAEDWEAFARYMTAGGERGEPPSSTWAITCGLAAEVLAGRP